MTSQNFPNTPFRDLPFWAQQARIKNENRIVLHYLPDTGDRVDIEALEAKVDLHGMSAFRLRLVIRRLQMLGDLTQVKKTL